MTLRKGGENIWVKDSNASESISEDFRKLRYSCSASPSDRRLRQRFVIAAELEQKERRGKARSAAVALRIRFNKGSDAAAVASALARLGDDHLAVRGPMELADERLVPSFNLLA